MRFSWIMFYGLLLAGCTPHTDSKPVNPFSDSIRTAREGDTLRDMVREQAIARLQHFTDSVCAQDFTLETNVFYAGVYLHKTWKNNPNVDRNGLVAITQSNGWLGLVSNLGKKYEHPHNRLVIQIVGEESFETDSTEGDALSEPELDGSIRVPNAQGEVRFIYKVKADPIVRTIALHPEKEVIIDAYYNYELSEHYILSETDRRGIEATYFLSQQLKELQKLKEEDETYH